MKLVNTRVFRSLAVLLIAGGFILSEQLRPFVPSRWGPGGIRITHLLNRFPLLFHVNDKAATGTPNLSAGSDALTAIKASLAAWGNIQTSAVRFADIQLTSVESPMAGDGTNLITMADTPANREVLGGDRDTGTLALTRLVFGVTNGKISDADILVNPRYRFSTTLDAGTFDLQSVITHELGHVLGCDHASALNDTMFFQIAEQSSYQRYLSPDSVAFVSFTYPSVDHPIPIGNI